MTHASTSDAASPSSAETSQPATTLIRVPMPVRWRDLDAFNHVNNATYLTYLEDARLQWLMQIRGEWRNAHAMPVLVASQLNYRRPIAWPARISVELDCQRMGNSSLTLGHRIVDDDQETVCCDGHVVTVWMDPSTGKPVPLPAAVREAAGG